MFQGDNRQAGEDVRGRIQEIAAQETIGAGFIVTCVGSLSQATLRMAGAEADKQDARTYEGDFEVLSLVGTVSADGVHLHATLSDTEGSCFGGHLKDGCIVKTTMELVIGESADHRFRRASGAR